MSGQLCTLPSWLQFDLQILSFTSVFLQVVFEVYDLYSW
jgi:hypothetical protein